MRAFFAGLFVSAQRQKQKQNVQGITVHNTYYKNHQRV